MACKYNNMSQIIQVLNALKSIPNAKFVIPFDIVILYCLRPIAPNNVTGRNSPSTAIRLVYSTTNDCAYYSRWLLPLSYGPLGETSAWKQNEPRRKILPPLASKNTTRQLRFASLQGINIANTIYTSA